MQNLSKIDTAKDLVTKEWVEAQDFLPSSAFTKNGIKNALGIADWALAASKPSYDDVYLKLAGGTISGNLTVSGQFKAQTSLASVSLLSNIFDVNASLKVQPGWNLYLNGEAIMKWSDLKSKITYSFSEIGSKPTSLDGYGITDAVRTGSNFDATSQKPWILGYSNTAHGWKGAGPAMIWGTPGYYTRLNVLNENTDDPQLFISNVYENQEKGWAKIVTDKNISNHSISHTSLRNWKPSDAGAKMGYVYGDNGWATNGAAMSFPIGNYTGLFNFTSRSDKANDLYIAANVGGTVSPWTKILTEANIANSTALDSRYLKLAGGTIDGSLTINGRLVGQAISNPINANVTNKWRFIYADNGIYLQAGTSDGNTPGNLYFSGYTGVAANKITFKGLTSEFSGNVAIGGSLTITGNGITLGGKTISNWNQVRMGASVLIPMTGTQILYPNEHYTYVETLTSSSNISFTLTDDTSGVSVTKIYYIVFQTGSTTPTFTFNRTLYWKDGKNLTALAANKRYRIVIDKDLATLETYS